MLVIERKTTSRNHTMGMWMVQDVLTPRMQHAHETDVCAQMLRDRQRSPVALLRWHGTAGHRGSSCLQGRVAKAGVAA